MVDVGARIKYLLKSKGIKQADLARRLEKSPQNISSALKKPSMTTDFLQEIMLSSGIRSEEIFEDGTLHNRVEEKRAAYITADELMKLKELEHALDLCKQEKVYLQEQIKSKDETIVDKVKIIDLLEAANKE